MLRSIFLNIYLSKTSRAFATSSESFNPSNLANLVNQPLSSSYSHELSAFAHRTTLQDLRPQVLLQSLTHKSFLHGTVPYNERLEILGRSLLHQHATEYVHFRYPKLPAISIHDAIEVLVGDVTLGQSARRLGMQQVVRWTSIDGVSRPLNCLADDSAKSVSAEVPPGQNGVLSKAFNALVGACYNDLGFGPTKNFVNTFVLYRSLQPEQLVRYADSKKLLGALLKRNERNRPITRILSETGRSTHSPLFIVGVFSGNDQLGEGRGTSLKLAERMAIKDALTRHFGQESEIRLPSELNANEVSWVPPAFSDSSPIV